jgi:hypothetical protein
MKRHVIRLLLVWTVCLPTAGSFVSAESLSFLESKIRIYPAQREGQYILIPFAQPPEDDEEVLLLHSFTEASRLKRVQKKTITPKSMVNPHPHYVYGLADGHLSDPGLQFLVAVGKSIQPLIKWKAAGVMKGEVATECIAANKEFATDMVQVLTDEELNVKFYYLQEELLQSRFDSMTEEEKNSAIWMKETVGLVDPQGDCHVLAYNMSDAYGMKRTGIPVGPVFGIIQLARGSSTEQWLVLKSATSAMWGYTFIQLQPMASNRDPKTRFLVEDRI